MFVFEFSVVWVVLREKKKPGDIRTCWGRRKSRRTSLEGPKWRKCLKWTQRRDLPSPDPSENNKNIAKNAAISVFLLEITDITAKIAGIESTANIMSPTHALLFLSMCVWYVYLVCIWCVFGVYLVCIRCVFGVYLVCICVLCLCHVLFDHLLQWLLNMRIVE